MRGVATRDRPVPQGRDLYAPIKRPASLRHYEAPDVARTRNSKLLPSRSELAVHASAREMDHDLTHWTPNSTAMRARKDIKGGYLRDMSKWAFDDRARTV